jgi:indole-3-glycerol phosphate synthase
MHNAAPDVLAAIVAATRRIVEVRRASLPQRPLEAAVAAQPDRRGVFEAALRGGRPPRVIAECKRRSPSRGILRRDYDPVALAGGYERAGAAAVSVLTEPTFFDGRPEHLQAVRRAVALPILRKDFIVDGYQLLEARAWGADAVLLIAAALTGEELTTLVRGASELGLAALVEVHHAGELRRAVDAGARIIGVNNRNLQTLAVDTAISDDLIDLVPEDTLAVAESGLRTREDLDRLASAGYDGFLIGERLMAADDPAQALAALIGVAPPCLPA